MSDLGFRIENYKFTVEQFRNPKSKIPNQNMASFSIDYPGTPQQFVVNANSAIKNKGGVFNGTDQKGVFSLQTKIGKVEGNYEVLPNSGTPTKVAITITKKPFIVPMSAIQEVIGGYF